MVKLLKRRNFIKTAGASGAVTLFAPYVKTSISAGRLNLGLWDHWIPGANDVLEKIVVTWGKNNGVDIKIDNMFTNIR